MVQGHGLCFDSACLQFNVQPCALSFADEFATPFLELSFADEAADSNHAACSFERDRSEGPELSVASSITDEPEQPLSSAHAKELAGSDVRDIGSFKLPGSGERSERQRDGAYVVLGQDCTIARERGSFANGFEGTVSRANSGTYV